MRFCGLLERECLADKRLQPAGGSLGERGPREVPQFLRCGTPAANESGLVRISLFQRDVRERATGHTERAEPPARPPQVKGGPADAAAHAVEDDIDTADFRGDAIRPSRSGVVDHHAGAQLSRKLELAFTTRGADD